MTEKRESYCAYAFCAVKQGLDRELKPCCRFIDYDETYEKATVDTCDTLSDVIQNKFKHIQDRMLENVALPECSRCYAEEDAGKVSLRQKANEHHGDVKGELKYIELAFSNKCNLKCRMCSSMFSYKWLHEEQILNLEPQQPLFELDIDKYFSEITKAETIKIVGGEPFISKQFLKFLKTVNKEDITKINLEIFTNGTFYPKNYIDTLSQFKSLDLYFSIDGISKVNDYIRHGSNWNNISNVIDKWVTTNLPNTKLRFHTTYQAYNAHDVENIFNYANDRKIITSISKLSKPNYLTVNLLPKKYKEDLRNMYLQSRLPDRHKYFLVNLLKEHNDYYFNEFKSYTQKLDALRNESLKEFIPELYNATFNK